MSLVRRIARPLLAAPFILEGVRTAKNPEREIAVVPAAFAQVDKALENSSAPSFVDSRMIVRATGVVAAGAGVLYATNRAPRLSAALLLAATSVGLANRKRIWELTGEERMNELQSILTDAGLLGGVLLAVVDTDGTPSLGYRVNKLVERGQKAAEQKQKEIGKATDKLSRRASKGTSKRKLKKAAKKARKQASSLSDSVASSASKSLDSVTSALESRLSA